MKPRALLPLGLAALSVLAFAAQGIVIKRVAKVGDKADFTLKGTFSVQGAEVKLSGTSKEEVTKVENDTVTTKSSSKLTVNVLGDDQEIPESSEEQVQKLDGTVIKVMQDGKDATSAGIRLSHLNMLLLSDKPLAINDTWVAEGKKDEKADVPGYKITYKLIGEEKIGRYDTYKISAEGGEIEGAAPSKVKATYWVTKSTGEMARSLAELTDVVFDDKYPAMSGTMDIVRKD